MVRSSGKPFTVDTRPTKIALVNSLTRDISVEACVFDLIDNAVDSAREAILSNAGEVQNAALPSSYTGYEVRLDFEGTRFSIADNCGGISVTDMQSTALRFGKRSTHLHGIGIFGLGLNRALFKLGNVSTIHTDTGKQRSELVLNNEAYLQDTNSWDIPARQLKSTGSAGTVIEITQLQSDIAQTFADAAWIDNFRDEISRRYGRFISKGLVIVVNGVQAVDGQIKIRDDGPFAQEFKFYSVDGVAIYIQVGQHLLHRFSAEPGYDKSSNALLTSQYGWTVLCNDRAVVMSDRSWKTGWDAKFHTEFYGFVGVVNFVSDSPSSLPWDTTKSDVDLNNRAYQAALEDMRKFALSWRKFANVAKALKIRQQPLLPLPGTGPAPVPTPAAGVAAGPASAPTPRDADKRRTKAGKAITTQDRRNAVKLDHNQLTAILPVDILERYCDDKHLALVHEAKTFNLRDFPYSGMALMRVLFEVSAVKFFDRFGKLGEVQDFVLAEREKRRKKSQPRHGEGNPADGSDTQANELKQEDGTAPDVETKKLASQDPARMTVSLEEYLTYMERNPAMWGAVKAGHMQQAVRNVGARKKLLNGVVHNPYQTINRTEAFAIRDEALPLLRHLIESDHKA
ncbi:ATP-binding protein [Achromobacter insuavis]|uniref:ATP-binding protein n=1 Tax=Achromobacter insuavis TaxID=1287735 RepID=UPI000B187DE6|nr:ATP-binding protein [Achromobacter insuavis]